MDARRAAAAFAGLSLDLPETYTHFQDNLKPEFLNKFPLGKIPALEAKDGFKVFETVAIARYSESSAIFCIICRAGKMRSISLSVIPVLTHHVETLTRF